MTWLFCFLVPIKYLQFKVILLRYYIHIVDASRLQVIDRIKMSFLIEN